MLLSGARQSSLKSWTLSPHGRHKAPVPFCPSKLNTDGRSFDLTFKLQLQPGDLKRKLAFQTECIPPPGTLWGCHMCVRFKGSREDSHPGVFFQPKAPTLETPSQAQKGVPVAGRLCPCATTAAMDRNHRSRTEDRLAALGLRATVHGWGMGRTPQNSHLASAQDSAFPSPLLLLSFRAISDLLLMPYGYQEATPR